MRAETKHHMGRRCNDWDYGQRAIYMVTISMRERGRPALAEWPERIAVSGDAQNRATDPGDGESCAPPEGVSCAPPEGVSCAPPETAGYVCPRTALGEKVLSCWHRIPEFWPMVSLIEAVVMPDHFHGILFVKERLPGGKCLGDIIRGFKTGCREAGWAEGFVDTILFHEGQLSSMVAYIRANPARLAEKRAKPDLFHRVASISLPLDGGRLVGRFEAIGNRHLLARPLHLVQCSRRFFAWRRAPKAGGGLKIVHDAAGDPVAERATAAYQARLDDALAAAEHGTVIISPCISDGERQIAMTAHKRKLPLVAMRNMGFSKMEKPAGRLFDACAEGRLLLLAPAAWQYTTQEKPMTRSEAIALNRICQWLAGGTAAEISYHGMVPADIDRLAMEAVLAME